MAIISEISFQNSIKLIRPHFLTPITLYKTKRSYSKSVSTAWHRLITLAYREAILQSWRFKKAGRNKCARYFYVFEMSMNCLCYHLYSLAGKIHISRCRHLPFKTLLSICMHHPHIIIIRGRYFCVSYKGGLSNSHKRMV